jgi:hypothetical protein
LKLVELFADFGDVGVLESWPQPYRNHRIDQRYTDTDTDTDLHITSVQVTAVFRVIRPARAPRDMRRLLTKVRYSERRLTSSSA